MFNRNRIATVAATVVLLGTVTACGSQPTYNAPPPPVARAVEVPVNYAEYGRIANIEYVRTDAPRTNGVAGTIIGGVLGGVVGHQVGGGSGKDIATVVGAAGGALAGNRVERNNAAAQAHDVYRVSVQMEGGAYRAYELLNPGDLRVGDRVVIQNGQIVRA